MRFRTLGVTSARFTCELITIAKSVCWSCSGQTQVGIATLLFVYVLFCLILLQSKNRTSFSDNVCHCFIYWKT